MYSNENGSVFGGFGGLIAVLVVLFLFGNNNWNNKGSSTAEMLAASNIAAGARNTAGIMDVIAQGRDIERSICANGYATQTIGSNLQRDIMQGDYNIARAIDNSTAALHAAVTACCCENQKGLLQLGNMLERHSCDIIDAIKEDGAKTRQQAADYRLQDVQTNYNFAQATISNDRQSQYILGQLGRYVTNTPNSGCCNTCNTCNTCKSC